MKVLIITYYWPPAGGSGVQRWLKFVKYLRDFGIEPVVYTVDDVNYPKEDKSLLSEIPKDFEVLKKSIWEPTDLLFWKKKNEHKNHISNATNSGLLSFIRGNFFIPDPKVFWVNSSVDFLSNYLKNTSIDLLISTGPPHSMHLIAEKLKDKFGLPWLADFRDPWTDLYYQNEFKQLNFAKNKNEKLEASVLQNADCILTVSNALQQDLLKKASRVAVITNGFDDEVLQNDKVVLDKEFSISYIGLLPKQSNPTILFDVLKEICEENNQFRNDLQLNLIGDIANEVKTEISKNRLTKNTNFVDYVSHQKAIDYQKKAQVLLLLIPNVDKAEGILTGKLFEYLTAKRPILAISPSNGDLYTVLKETNAGKIFDFEAKETLKSYVLELYQQYKEGNLVVNSKNIMKYHRKELTKQLATLIKSLHS